MSGATVGTAQWAVDELLACEAARREREPLTAGWPDLDLDTAYRVQDQLVQRRKEAGDRVVGVKLGLTSRAKQRRMGIDAPLTGWLTDAMVLPAGEPVPVPELIHPRIEPELVFVLGEDVCGPGMTAARAMGAVRSVHAGAEIIDSRYRDYRFTLPDVVADNASAARYVVGPVARRLEGLDLTLEAALVEVEGQVVDSATGAAVQGHPAEALALAANSLATRGLKLRAGWIVLTGGMTDAVPIGSGGTVAVHFSSLGSIVLRGA